MSQYNAIVVIGPTASGKSRLGVKLAERLQGEIISADSRQVFRGMDIGTGKDLAEYCGIHQFAKRQETWFRRMGRQGTKANWLNGRGDTVEQALMIIEGMSPS